MSGPGLDAEPDWMGVEPKPGPRTWDFLLTGLLVVLALILTTVFAVTALGFGIITQACTAVDSGCDASRVHLGQLLCTFAPPAIALVTIVVSVIRVSRRRIGFWVVLLGIALMLAVFTLGRWLMDSGMTSSLG